MKRPNILYIMSDDHCANSISCYNSILSTIFKTPNIDSIANEGARVDNFFATNSICTPARATVITGQYGHISGVKTLADRWDSSTDPNVAKLIHNSGYTTAFFGKWHLYGTPVGFDDYKYLETKNGNEQGLYFDPTFMEKGKDGLVEEKGYVTDIITDMTVDWLKNRDTDKPFFVMCHHKAPHDLWEYAPRFEHLFDGVEIPQPENLFEDLSHRSEGSRDFGSRIAPNCKYGHSLYGAFQKPTHPTGVLQCDENATDKEKTIKAYEKYVRDYLRTVAGIDESVGKILQELKNQGELDNTVVIYTSDQGQFMGEHNYWDKRWSFEESLRAPFLIRYPKEIEKGSVAEGLCCNLGIAPLLLDYAGVDVPKEMQGTSFRKVVTGEDKKGEDAIYFRYWMHMAHHAVPSHYGIRTDKYKLIYYYGLPLGSSGALDEITPTGWELYDIVNDKLELHNIYNDEKYADVIKELKVKLNELKVKYKDTDEQYPELLQRLD